MTGPAACMPGLTAVKQYTSGGNSGACRQASTLVLEGGGCTRPAPIQIGPGLSIFGCSAASAVCACACAAHPPTPPPMRMLPLHALQLGGRHATHCTP
jgi:hypothetical protein